MERKQTERQKELEKKATTYEQVGIANGLTGLLLRRYVTYMKLRWWDDETGKVFCGYAKEWALRFLDGHESTYSDVAGCRILSMIGHGVLLKLDKDTDTVGIGKRYIGAIFDMAGYIQFCLKDGKEPAGILATIAHDINGLVNIQDKDFTPRSSGYVRYLDKEAK